MSWFSKHRERKAAEHQRVWGQKRDVGLYPVIGVRNNNRTFAFYGHFPEFGRSLPAGYGWWIIGRTGIHNDKAFSFIGKRIPYVTSKLWPEGEA